MKRTRRPLRVTSAIVLLAIGGSTLVWAAMLVRGLPLRAQEHSQWCWAGSGQAVLAYYGKYVPQCAIVNYTYSRGDCCDMPADFGTSHSCNTPGWPRVALSHWGVPNQDVGNALSQASVVSEINADRPFVMVFAWKCGDGSLNCGSHALVGYGYEQDGAYVDYMDPSPGHGYTVSTYEWTVNSSSHMWNFTELMTISANAWSNLAPVTLSGWSAPIVVSTGTGTSIDTVPLRVGNPLYVDWAIGDNAPAAVLAPFYAYLYVDGVIRNPWYVSSVQSNSYASATDYSLGSLPIGTHTLRLVADATGLIQEGNESDNEYTKTITILPPPTYYIDFNGDSSPDMVWRNRVTGDISIWLMDGLAKSSEVILTGPSDRNWKIVAVADMDLDGHADLVWRNAVTGANVVWLMNGTTYTGWGSLPTVADAAWHIVGAADMNGDGKPDLVWHNQSTGQNVAWFMNGTTYGGAGEVPAVSDVNWTIAGVDDFNGDGKPDLLWRNMSTGQNLIWFMNGTIYASYATVPTRTSEWVVGGTGDYNADHKADIVWRNINTGVDQVDYMNGWTVVSTAALPTVTDPDWDVLHSPDSAQPGPSDFNIDGYADILWHNTSTGANTIWYMNRVTHVTDGTVATDANLNWKPVAVADFDQDGLPDIVWRNTSTGANRIWLMTGHLHTGDMTLPTIADANWKVVGVGDFNRDGHPDLVWRNYSTGANVIWFLHNGAYYDWTAPPTITDTNWQIVGVGDFNGDGWPDLFWRNQATGANVAWFLVNGVYVGWGAPPTIADTAWQIVGVADFNVDGKADLFWRNATTGQNLVWYLNNGTYIGWAALPSLDVAWKTGAGQ